MLQETISPANPIAAASHCAHRSLDDLLTSNELAKALKVSDRLPENWRLQGTGPKFIRVGGRRVLYRWADVLDYLLGRSFTSTSEESTKAT